MVSISRPPGFQDWKAVPSNAVLQEIGRLAIITAGVEDLIHGIIWRYLNIEDSLGSVITGRFKLKQLQDNCIKILKAADAPTLILKDLEEIFSEIDKSAELRNKCVHWIWHRAHSGSKGLHRLDPPAYQQEKKEIYISAKQIKQAADNLVWLETRLYPHIMNLDHLYKLIRQDGPDDLPTPWLCIFPQPERKST